MRANSRDPANLDRPMPDSHSHFPQLSLAAAPALPLVVVSRRSKVPDHTSFTMTATSNDLALSRVLALIEDKEVREKLEEVARFYFTSSNITVNLLPAIAGTLFVVGGIGLLLWLLGFDMGDGGHSGSGSGYGAAASSKASYTYDDTIAELQAQVGT